MNLDTEATESLNVPSDFVSAIRLTIQAHQFIQKHVHICNLSLVDTYHPTNAAKIEIVVVEQLTSSYRCVAISMRISLRRSYAFLLHHANK